METNILGTNLITQIGILVHDIEKTAQAYAHFFGVEKPQSVLTVRSTKRRRNTEESLPKPERSSAFFDMGSLQLELIEPDRNPSTWRESLDKNGEGPHHIAFVIQGMKEKIAVFERNRMPLLQKGEYEGGRYAYIDTLRDLKVIIELLENDS